MSFSSPAETLRIALRTDIPLLFSVSTFLSISSVSSSVNGLISPAVRFFPSRMRCTRASPRLFRKA